MTERGQSLVISVLFLTVLAGMAVTVLDIGSWYRAHRKLQANADAAALAGAQALPEDVVAARTIAVDYGDRNDGGVAAENVKFSRGVVDDDTITVTAERRAPGFFARLFGFDSVDVRAKAAARTGVPGSVRWAAPIGVDHRHPKLAGPNCPCWEESTDLDLDKVGPGAFRILNIDGSRGGTSSSTLGDWILRGLDADMPLGWYYSDPGASFNSSHVRDALKDRFGTELLLPIYADTRGNGSGFDYKVIGWAGFHVTEIAIHGSKSKVFGWFERVVWEGIVSETEPGTDFGVRSVALVE